MQYEEQQEFLTAPGQGENHHVSRRRLAKISAKEQTFYSYGVAVLRITKDGVSHPVELPIRAMGMMEIYEELDRQRPIAPRKRLFVDPGSELAKQSGQSGFVTQRDETDKEYLDALAAWLQRSTYLIVLHGLDLDVEDAQGEIVWSRDGSVRLADRAIQALTSSGLTQNHFTDLNNQIQALTKTYKEDVQKNSDTL